VALLVLEEFLAKVEFQKLKTSLNPENPENPDHSENPENPEKS
jgi:hypothetical protein